MSTLGRFIGCAWTAGAVGRVWNALGSELKGCRGSEDDGGGACAYSCAAVTGPNCVVWSFHVDWLPPNLDRPEDAIVGWVIPVMVQEGG
jgi:hypothetical protein